MTNSSAFTSSVFTLTADSIRADLAAVGEKLAANKPVVVKGRKLKNAPEHVEMEAPDRKPISTLGLSLRGVELKIESYESGYLSVKNASGFSANRKTFGHDYDTLRGLLSALHAMQDAKDVAVFVPGCHAPRGIEQLKGIYDLQDRVLHVNWDRLMDAAVEARLAKIGVVREDLGDQWVAYNAENNKVFRYKFGMVFPMDNDEVRAFIAKWEEAGNKPFKYWDVNRRNWSSKRKHDAVDVLLDTMNSAAFCGVGVYKPFDWELNFTSKRFPEVGMFVAHRAATLKQEWSLLWAKPEDKKALRVLDAADYEAQEELNGTNFVRNNPEQYPDFELKAPAKESIETGTVVIYTAEAAVKVTRASLLNTRVAYVYANGMKARDGRPIISTDDHLTAALNKCASLKCMLTVVEQL